MAVKRKTLVEQVLDFVQQNGPMRRREIARYFIEVIKGLPYTRENAKRYAGLSSSFCDVHGGYFRRPVRGRSRYFKKVSDEWSAPYGVFDKYRGWLTPTNVK